jgi:hypothetical protein
MSKEANLQSLARFAEAVNTRTLDLFEETMS